MMRGKSPFFWFAILAGLFLSCLFILQTVNAFRIGSLEKVQGWKSVPRPQGWELSVVDPTGPAWGKLRIGDRILAVNGDTRAAKTGPHWKLQDAPPDSSYSLTIQRGPEILTFDLTLPVRKREETLIWILIHLLVSSAFMATGLLVALYKPDDYTARLGFAVSMLASVFMLWLASNPLGGMLQGFSLWVSLALSSVFPLHIVFGYLFLENFPQPVETKGIWKITKWAIVLLGLAIWAQMTSLNFLRALGGETVTTFLFNNQRVLGFYYVILSPLQLLFLGLTALATLAVGWRNYRRLAEGDLQRRLRWVAWGALVSTLPVIAVSIFWFLVRATGKETGLATAILITTRITNTLVIILPITMAYAIIRHRVLGISVVLRIGLQYLLAKNVLRFILFLPMVGLAYVILSNPDRTMRELLLSGSAKVNLALLLAAILGMRYRRQLMNLIDRKFFREAYQKEHILLELNEAVKHLNSVPEISQVLRQEIERALHSQWLTVLFWEGGRKYYSSYSTAGSGQQLKTLELPENELLITQLEELRTTQSREELRENFPPDSIEWLDRLGAHLLVPIFGTERKMMGLLLLGEKRSEEPYTKNDRHMLEAVAAQIGIVYENLSLKERVRHEQQIQAQVLARLEDKELNIVKECPECGFCYDLNEQACRNDGRRLELTLPVERVVDGKYRLERLVGKGGMGAVYEATDMRLNRKIAVKAMLSTSFGDRSALQRFTREAQASAKLNHPNIVRVFDFGELRGGGAYLVMEYVRGRSWRQELGYLGTFHGESAADMIDQLLSGVEAAHRARVLHRDLKPDNILITYSPEASSPSVKILDFGLAKVRELDFSDPKSLTKSGVVIGTLGYMSPEQFLGSEVDERTDIYSLGVIILETLTGELGTLGLSFHHRIADLLSERFRFDGAVNEHQMLAQILKKCLALDRNERFQNVAEMRQMLIQAIRRCPPFPSLAQRQKDGSSRFITHASTLRKSVTNQAQIDTEIGPSGSR